MTAKRDVRKTAKNNITPESTKRLIAAILAGARCGPGCPHDQYLDQYEDFLAAIDRRAEGR